LGVLKLDGLFYWVFVGFWGGEWGVSQAVSPLGRGGPAGFCIFGEYVEMFEGSPRFTEPFLMLSALIESNISLFRNKKSLKKNYLQKKKPLKTVSLFSLP
jgi:hypothetical protein